MGWEGYLRNNRNRKLKLFNWIRARLRHSCSNILFASSDCEILVNLFCLFFPFQKPKKKGMDCSDLIFQDAFSQCYRVQSEFLFLSTKKHSLLLTCSLWTFGLKILGWLLKLTEKNQEQNKGKIKKQIYVIYSYKNADRIIGNVLKYNNKNQMKA